LSTSPLRIGLIGCGRIAQAVHLPILRRLPGVEVAAIAEPDGSRLKEGRRLAPSARAFADYEDVLALPEVQAVVICLPTGQHAPACTAALEAGKHVYLEKPLAADLEEARQVLRAWRHTDRTGAVGQTGMIGFNYRFHPLLHALRGRLEREGEAPFAARSVFAVPARELPQWKRSRATGGGVLLDLASHHIDLFRFLFRQEVREVSAGLRSGASEDDTAWVRFTLTGGLRIDSFFSLCACDEDRIEIYGRGGKLAVDRYRSWNVEETPPEGYPSRLEFLRSRLVSCLRSPVLRQKLRTPGSEPSYEPALRCFVSAARKGGPVSPDFEDGYRSLAVVAAAEESARTGRPVLVPGGAGEGA
jgi:myo-inositol 2-dehydrogenase / D-chiro-inositol 1-dehydrogenase